MPAKCPRGAFAGSKIGMVGVGVFFGGIDLGNGFSVSGQFGQIAGEPVRIAPGLAVDGAVRLFDIEANLDAGQQHRFRAEKAFQFRRRYAWSIEVFGVGPYAHPGAALATASACLGQRTYDFPAAGKVDGPDLSLAPYFDRDPGG